NPDMPVLERSMIGLARNALLALVACLACLGPLAAQAPAVIDAAPVTAARIEAVAARHGMVAAQEARAARLGVEILEAGGNAVDAAVATGFALAVTYPRAGNIGGGGYMLIHRAGGKTDTAIDYRETAPAATTREIFLDERGEADPRKSQDSALAIGVPGTVAGLALAHANYGSREFTLAPLHPPPPAGAGVRLGRRRHPHRERLRGLAPAVASAPGALPRHDEDLLRRRPSARPGRDVAAARPRRHAHRHRPRGANRVLSRLHRGEARRRRPRRGRHHDARGSRALPADRAHAHRRQLSRLSHRLDAAVLVRRRRFGRDAEHS